MTQRKSILLRLRTDTYAALQRWAADEFRSVNGQMEYLLDRALREAGRRPTTADHGSGDAESEAEGEAEST